MAKPIAMTDEQIKQGAYAIADVLCWFNGFQAAHFGRENVGNPPMPPGLDKLRDLRFAIEKGLDE